MKFLQVDTIEEAREKLLKSALGWLPKVETVPLEDASGRVLAKEVAATEDLPHFRRSTVDGFAVQAKDTAAAGESIPTFLDIVGAVEMGKTANFEIKSGQCAEIPTGGMVPLGADAVVMVEYCELFGDDGVAIYKSCAHGSHVVQIGDDMKAGTLLMPVGRCLTPQDIGTLAVAGVGEVAVFARPSICFISTGDELLSPHTSPLENGKIRETNSLSLSALARKLGFNVEKTMTLPDDENTIKQAIIQSMEKYDIVAITGGSSQGKKDMTAEILDAVSGGGVFTHGIAIKPGKPTILGVDKPSQTLLVGLPGHPVSSMTVFELIFGWLWRRLMGVPEGFPIVAKLTDNVPGSAGKLTFYACKLSLDADGYKACPIFSKSGLISSLSAADGYFLIAQDTEGLRKNDTVHVHLY